MRILIVDDHALTREAFRLALRRHAELDFAAGVADAFDLLERAHYDLYLVDEILPDGSGAALLRRVRERGFDGWRVLMSGDSEPAGFESGAYDCFVQKPDDVDVLVRRIRERFAGGDVERPLKGRCAGRRECE